MSALNLRRLKAVARKEFLHVLRDPRALGIAILLPMIMLMIFGYALTLDLDRVPLAVFDQSRTPQSRELVGASRAPTTSPWWPGRKATARWRRPSTRARS